MLDLKFVCENIEMVQEKIAQRRGNLDFGPIVDLSKRRLKAIKTYEDARHIQRNSNKEISTLAKGSDEFIRFREYMKEVSQTAKNAEAERNDVEAQLMALLLYIPNLTHESVPRGTGEEDNEILWTWGEPPEIDNPRPHWELCESLDLVDFARASKIAGARFAVMKNAGALLERALINFMLDLARERGYQEIVPPYMVNRQSMIGTGQLPKFEDDAFKLDGVDYFMIPTAEVPLTNLHADEILAQEALPIKYVAHTPCFRKEAGAAGKDTRGLIRQHQFNKVELVKIVEPDNSFAELESLLDDACEVLRLLGLHFRVISLCTADIGFAATKCYDIEVWLPGHGAYMEISSCSNCGDFQARRAKIRYRPGETEKGKPRLVHTLNGSALAVGRTLVAIMENYQQPDGTIVIPEALRAYAGGLKKITI